MHENPEQALALRVGIALACLRRPVVRAFAGCGQSRRRELHLVDSMADTIAGDLGRSLAFWRDGTKVIRSRVARYVASVLLTVPESLARDWCAVDANIRDHARLAIGASISARLLERYTVTPDARPVIVPAANVWCGISEI
ncbi:MAG: hypothetical protein ABS40_04125 [Agrobacterium sp. SCN 61-19]|nr:MAG: hypothetical protein ABS40_04125 [Agrobacterium sp. SCN 61-19]